MKDAPRAHGNWRTALAALLMVLGLAALAPVPAATQLGGLLGSLIVTITAPTAGATVGGTTAVSANVTSVGALTVVGVQFKVDGQDLGLEDRTAPYSVPWNTLTASNGQHRLTAVARDLLGLRYTSQPVTVTVFNDKTPPTVTITSPTDGRAVCCAPTITADARDNVGVVGVQFFANSAPVGTEDTTAPYTATWTGPDVPNGPHTLTATARDAAGNTASSSVTVMLENDMTPPTVAITGPAAGATVAGIISVFANAWDNTRVVQGRFFVDGVRVPPILLAPSYSWNWDTTTATNGPHTLRVDVWDMFGNPASTEIPVTVANDTGDTTPPTVTITSPAAGETISGVVSLDATASDNIVSVQILIPVAPDSPEGGPDSSRNGFADTTAPYTATWDTRTKKNGPYTLTAEARDQAGHVTTADPVTVIVANTPDSPDMDETAPTVTITSPPEAATLSGSMTLTAGASDNHFVAAARFFVGGVPLDFEDETAPYEIAWDTAAWTDGPHLVTASARDLKGNTTHSDPVTVTTANGTTVTRTEETDAALTYAGTWTHDSGTSEWSGGSASKGYAVGQRATFRFTGTGVSWIGYRGPEAGTADVYLDGRLMAIVDAYASAKAFQVELYKAVGLKRGSHTLEIVVIGKNAASTDRLIAVDAFEVVRPTIGNGTGGGTASRIEDTDPAVAYTPDGSWVLDNRDREWSGGSAALGYAAGQRATLTFTGTGVSWIGLRGPQVGIADVHLDGATVATVDDYAQNETVGAGLYTVSGLASGTHTLVIEPTGTSHPSSAARWIVVDAFDVVR